METSENSKTIKYDLTLVIPTFDNVEYIDEFIDSVYESIGNFNIEILVGIDNCHKTKNYILNNIEKYKNNTFFLFFEKNVGPYIIRNSLSKFAKSDKILFVDSDDLIEKTLIEKTIKKLNEYDIFRFKFYNFKTLSDIEKYDKLNVHHFHSMGQLGIRKKILLKMNGFEPWICGADSEFMKREEIEKLNTHYSNDVLYYRRRHDKNLTIRQDTGQRSKIREKYNKIILLKKQNPNYKKLSKLNVSNFLHLNNGIFTQINITDVNASLELFYDNKDLSIIIPTYKNVQFLPECFDSILKSIKNLECEILVGIDSCQETLEYVKNNVFDSRFKFYLFEKNVGPYVIKNTLANVSSSNKILFFDSDDIMTENLIPNVIDGLNSHKVYRPMYVDFIDGTKIRPFNNLKTNHFGYGVIGIDKETFLSLNGFEGWRCEADNDFLNRLNSRNIPILHGISITILRRIHKNGLTSHPNTNYKSQLREQYRKLSGKHRPNGKCKKFETANFIEVKVNGFENDKKDIFELKREEKRKLLNSVIPTKKETKVDYNSINSVLNRDNGFTTKSKIKEPVQNLPKERKEILEKKKESNYELIKKLLSDNPNKKHKYPDIEPFRKKN